ncbi:MAG TPA: helix-turn-helix transcriptional regulator [Gammaproteobacteria bacterium]|nr:helix-turn-helix transcriptional regulator [Gammaproteobacteria bacterium]
MNNFNPLLAKELLDLGLWLKSLRKKRKMTIADLCARIGVNPRTISKIEKGDPTVSVAVLFQYLDILGLAQGVAVRILGDYLSMVSAQKKSLRIFSDDEMDF